MAAQPAHVCYRFFVCALIFFSLFGMPSQALSQVSPLGLSVTDDNIVVLSIDGETWPLQLNQPFSATEPTPFHLSGHIKNQPKDRFALTVHQWPSDVAGSISIKQQWYQIESSNSAAQSLGDLSTDSDLLAMQPDVNLIGDYARGVIDEVLQHESLNQPINFAKISNPTTRATNRTTTRALRVGIIVDSLFDEHHAGRGLARAMTIMNGVDAILQSNLGLAIEVTHIVDYTDPLNDPFRALESNINSLLMPALQTERIQNESLPDNLSLVHLFTGHKDQNTLTLVGLGWLNSVCNSEGFDVSLSSPFLFDTLLAAHEILHNLGADHDNSDRCETYAGIGNDFLMWSNISGNTTDRLSACSIDSARAALNADCAVNAIDMGINISLTSQANTTSHELMIQLINTDTSRLAPDATTLTALPANIHIEGIPTNCHLNADILECHHEPIAPTQQSEIRLLINTRDIVNTQNVNDTRVRSEVILNTNVDRNLINNVAILNLPTDPFSDDDWVTVSTNTSAVDSTTVSTTDASNEPTQTVVPLDSITQTQSHSSGFSGLGAASLGPLFSVLLLLGYRLVVTINRVKRQRF